MAVTNWLSIGSTSSFSVATTNDIALDNPGNALSDDNTYAFADIGGNDTTNEYNYFGFDFSSIPSGATIEGIELRYMAYGETTNIDAYVSIYNNATATSSSERTQTMTTSEATYTEGGATDMWGLTFTQAQLANDDLYARIYFTNDSGFRRSAYLDQIQIRVHYLEPNVAVVSCLSLTTTAYATTFFTDNAIVSVGIQSLTIATKLHFANPGPDLQLVYPIADIATGGWTLTTGTDFFAVLDDADTTHYAICDSAGENTDLIVKLDALMPPVYSAGLEICAYIYATNDGITLNISLLEGTTTLTSNGFVSTGASGSNPDFIDTWAFVRIPCSSTVTNSIQSWDDLRLKFNAPDFSPSDSFRVAYAYVQALPPIGTITFPASTIGSNSASITGASTIHEALSSSESSYVTINNTNEYFEVLLDTVTDPSSSVGHVFGFSVGSADTSMGNGETFSVALLQGTTTIKSTSDFYWENTGPFYYNVELTSTEADSITDYSDLRIKATITTGSSDDLRFYNVFLVVPEVSGTDANAPANLVSLTPAVYSATVNTGVATTANLISLTQAVYSVTVSTDVTATANLVSLTTAVYGATVDNAINATATVNFVSLTTAVYGVTVNTDQVIATNLVSLTPAVYSVTVAVSTGSINAVGLTSLTIATYSVTVNTDAAITVGLTSLAAVSRSVTVSTGITTAAGITSIAIANYSVTVSADVVTAVGLNTLTVTNYSAGINTNVITATELTALTIAIHSVVVNTDAVTTAGLVHLTTATHSSTASGSAIVTTELITSTVTSHSVTVSADAIASAGLITSTITIHSATVSTDAFTSTGLVSLTIANYSPVVSANAFATVESTSLTVTSHSATANTEVIFAAELTGLTITLHSTTINTSATIEVGLASLTIATYSRTVATGLTAEANLDQLSTATYSVTVSTDAIVAVGITSLTEASYASTAIGGVTQLVNSTTLTIGALSPTVTGDAIVDGGLQSLTVAAITPSVSDGASISVSVGICSNSITALTPTINYDYAVTTNPNGLTIGVLSTAVNAGIAVSVGNVQALTVTSYSITISGSATNIVQIVSLSIGTLATAVSTQVSVSTGLQSLTLSTIAPTILSGEGAAVNLVGLTIATYGVTVNYDYTVDAGLQTLTLTPFTVIFEIGNVNVYDGNNFIKRIVKVFDGNDWVTRALKHWDSTMWK